MRILPFSNLPPKIRFSTLDRPDRPVGRLLPLTRAKRLRYLFKRLLSGARYESWLKSVLVEREEDSYWLISL